MIIVNAMGQACPIPVVKTIEAINAMTAPDTVRVLVDNETAVHNLKKLAARKQAASTDEKLGENQYQVLIHITAAQLTDQNESADQAAVSDCTDCSGQTAPAAEKNTVVVISSREMGSGDPALGSLLMKGFLYALTSQETLPSAIIFYNGGAFLTCEGSLSLEDLQTLAGAGVEILTCGTCLQHYGLREKLRVGEVTNMYVIAEKLTTADLIIRP